MSSDDVARAAAPALPPGARLRDLDRVHDGPRSSVYRARLVTDADERPVIVKAFHAAGEGWVRECASLQTLAGTGVAAVLLGETAEPPVAILADLGPGPSLADALLGDDPDAAAAALGDWARALARMHRASRERQPAFVAELDRRAGDLPVLAAPTRVNLDETVRVLDTSLAALGVPVPGGAFDELRDLGDRLADDDGALTPGDLCPDNNVRIGGAFVLVDHEDAQWRHPAWDVACLQVPWPTCWCAWRLPAAVVRAALDAYRDSAGSPWATDARFAADVEAAATGWALRSTAALLDVALRGATHGGPAEVTPDRRAVLLHRLEQAAQTDTVPLVAELADRIAVELRHRWGADVRLALAPAFRDAL